MYQGVGHGAAQRGGDHAGGENISEEVVQLFPIGEGVLPVYAEAASLKFFEFFLNVFDDRLDMIAARSGVPYPLCIDAEGFYLDFPAQLKGGGDWGVVVE